MKRLSITFTVLLLFTSLSIFTQESPKAPAPSASPATWLSWVKSLRVPTKADLMQAQAYVNSKWRCLRYGATCSRKERALLATLSVLVIAALAKKSTPFISAAYTHYINNKFFTAIEKNDASMIKNLLQQGIDPNIIIDQRPALEWAVSLGKINSVRELLKAGANPNIYFFDSTPLMSVNSLTSTKDTTEDIVTLLLKAKNFDITAHNQGIRALDHYLGPWDKNINIAKKLIGAMLKIKDINMHDIIMQTLNFVAWNRNTISQKEYDQLVRYLHSLKEYPKLLLLPPVKQLPREVRGNIFEYIQEEPLTPAQQEKLMSRKP